MQMRQVEQIDLRKYKGTFAVICNGAEIIVGPENPMGMRHASIHLPSYPSGVPRRKENEYEFDDTISVGRCMHVFTGINESHPLHSRKVRNIYIQCDN